MIWIVASMLAAWIAALGFMRVDRVVTAPGRVVSKASVIVVQPLETAIVRSIDVHEGQQVRSGDLLVRLDPTFSAADVGALQSQVSSLEAEVSRMQAEVDGLPFQYAGLDPSLLLQATIHAQRESELISKLESHRQKIDGLKSRRRGRRPMPPPSPSGWPSRKALSPCAKAGGDAIRQSPQLACRNRQPTRNRAQSLDRK